MTLREKLFPWKTLQLCEKLIIALYEQITLLKHSVEVLSVTNSIRAKHIILLEKECERLKKDLSLAQMNTESSVDPMLRDGVLDPPEPKNWIN